MLGNKFLEFYSSDTVKMIDYISIIEFANALEPEEKLLVFFKIRPGRGESQEQIAKFFGVSQPDINYRLRKIRKKFKEVWIH